MKYLPPEFVAPLTPVNKPIRRCRVEREEVSPRVLIMRLGSFGDILMGTPLVSALRDRYPDAHITWIVERDFQDAIIANPEIDEVLLWEGRYWKSMLRRGAAPLWAVRALSFARTVRGQYDIFISFQPEEWPLLTRAVRAEKTIGVFDTFQRFNRDRPTSARTRLYTHAYVSKLLPVHRTDQYLLALDALELKQQVDKQMTLGYTQDDLDAVLPWTAGQQAPLVMVPRTTWPSRCWPMENWAKLAELLSKKFNVPILLLGSTKEGPELERLSAMLPVKSNVLAGTLTFRQAAALMAGAALVVTGDTGPMHAAAAVGAPTVALFGPTSRHNLAPQSGRVLAMAHDVPCGPCDQKECSNHGDQFMLCMRLLSVEEVFDAACTQLAAAGAFA